MNDVGYYVDITNLWIQFNVDDAYSVLQAMWKLWLMKWMIWEHQVHLLLGKLEPRKKNKWRKRGMGSVSQEYQSVWMALKMFWPIGNHSFRMWVSLTKGIIIASSLLHFVYKLVDVFDLYKVFEFLHIALCRESNTKSGEKVEKMSYWQTSSLDNSPYYSTRCNIWP